MTLINPQKTRNSRSRIRSHGHWQAFLVGRARRRRCRFAVIHARFGRWKPRSGSSRALPDDLLIHKVIKIWYRHDHFPNAIVTARQANEIQTQCGSPRAVGLGGTQEKQ